jgi:hypothetical protein
MTQEETAAVFEEWKRRYDEDPESYQGCEAFKADPPKSYGEAAARYFFFIIDEMTAEQVK